MGIRSSVGFPIRMICPLSGPKIYSVFAVVFGSNSSGFIENWFCGPVIVPYTVCVVMGISKHRLKSEWVIKKKNDSSTQHSPLLYSFK